MTNEVAISSLNKDFESIKKVDENGVEYWQARELMPLLGYDKWQNAEEVISRAARACVNSGQTVDNHFTVFSKMVEIGSNTQTDEKIKKDNIKGGLGLKNSFYGGRQSKANH